MRLRAIGGVVLAAAMLASTVTEAGAGATKTPDEHVRWAPAIPCAFWCAFYNIPWELGFRPCENPFPAGSYSDVLTGPAPDLGGTTVLVADIKVNWSWDLFVCAVEEDGGHNGPQVGRAGRYLGRACDYHSPEVPVLRAAVALGCFEGAFVETSPGERYVLRAYNRADVVPPHGSYRFVSYY